MKCYQLLANEQNWNKGAWAKNKEGVRCSEDSPLAVSWCVIGAISRCYSEDSAKIVDFFNKIENYLEANKLEKSIIKWNDLPETTHGQIIEVLKKLNI